MAIVKPQVRRPWAESAVSTEIVDPGESFVANGFQRSAIPPPRQFLNWVLNYCMNGLRYLCRRGICDYDPAETYSPNDIVRGDDNCVYQSLTRENKGNTPSVSSANWGCLRLYRRTSAEIDAEIMPDNLGFPELNVLRYGADKSGRIPCDAAIAAAICVACPRFGTSSNARHIYFPAGHYAVTKTIDLTNSRQPGTRIKDGLLVRGESSGCTFIVGQTGRGKAVIETTGSQWLSIEDLAITAATADGSSVGIFQGLSKALMETNNQRFTRIVIRMNDDMDANAGAGSVGIWNFGAEENTYDTIWISANLPLMFTAHNPSPNTGFATPASYHTLSSIHSLGLSTFTGECFLVSINKRQPSIVTEDANSMKFGNAYFANTGAGGTNQSAWKVYGSLTGLDFNGLVESHARLFDISGIIAGAKVRVTFGGIDSSTTERIRLNPGGQGQLLNCEFNCMDTVATARQLISTIPDSPCELVSCYVANCSFKVNCDQQFTTIQENVLWNPKTGNVTIEALRCENRPFRYSIDSNRTQEIAIPLTTISSGRGVFEAGIVKVALPVRVGNCNALSAIISVEGVAKVLNKTSQSVCKLFNCSISVEIDNSGVIRATVHHRGTKVSKDAIYDDHFLSFRSINDDADQSVTIVATAPRSGVDQEKIDLFGTARLHWIGNESRAPSLRVID
jgi:hypothetical protein